MSQSRDMSKAQFDAACKKRGFTPAGFMGYYNIGHGTSVCKLNAGSRRRSQLAYLIREAELAEQRHEEARRRFQIRAAESVALIGIGA